MNLIIIIKTSLCLDELFFSAFVIDTQSKVEKIINKIV